MSLSYSSVPYKGIVQITTDIGKKNVCWQSLNYNAMRTVCRQLGYYRAYSLVNVSTATNAKDTTFYGSISCIGEEKYLSQCSINASASESCSELSYIECIPVGKINKATILAKIVWPKRIKSYYTAISTSVTVLRFPLSML